MNTRDVASALSEVIDPELGIDIVSLGLLYGIELDETGLRLEVALISPDCPMGEVLLAMIAARARRGAKERRVAIEVWKTLRGTSRCSRPVPARRSDIQP